MVYIFLFRILSKNSSPIGLAGTPASGGGGLGLLKLNGSSPAHLKQLQECVDTWCSESYVQVCYYMYQVIVLDVLFDG